MWLEIKKKVLVLSSLDRERQLFGAEFHDYNLDSSVTEEQIKFIEKKLNIKLPDELQFCYFQLGNGGVGPDYGLTRLENINGYNQSEPYQGIDYFKKIAKKAGSLSEDSYFEISHGDIQGLISIIEQGGGHEICLVSCGEAVGKVVYVTCNGFIHESDQSLSDLYKKWLDNNILAFQKVRELIDSDKSMKEIDQFFVENFKRHDGRDLAISLIGAKKPIDIFGSGNHKKYHGAIQFPWYEEQLKNYKVIESKPWWQFWN